MTDFQFSMELWKAEDAEMRFRGIAATTGLDREGPGMELLPQALDMMTQFQNVPLLNWADGSHAADRSKAIGKAERFWREGDKVWTEGILYDWVPEARTIYDQLKDLEKGGQCAYAMSVGGKFDFGTDATGRRGIAKVQLTNLVVAPPERVMNPGCLMGLAKALAYEGEIGKALLPLAAENLAWDAGQARAAVKAWATNDQGEIDFAKYGQCFFWSAPDASTQEDYKLPFATIIDGEPHAVWNGVRAAYAALQGSRGQPPDIPNADVPSVLRRIARYYEAFGKEWPGEKEMGKSMTSTDFSENLAEARGEDLAESAALATGEMMEALNATLGQIIAQEIADSEKRMLIESAMADFADKLCERLAIDQPAPELTKATTQEVGDMPDHDETMAEPEAEVTETDAATPEAAAEPQEETAVTDEAQDEEAPAEADEESAPDETEPVGEEEAEEEEAEAAEVPLEKAEPAAEFADALEKALTPLNEQIATLSASLEKAQARIAELEGQPVAGGPASTAALETADRTLSKADPLTQARTAGDRDAVKRLMALRAMGG